MARIDFSRSLLLNTLVRWFIVALLSLASLPAESTSSSDKPKTVHVREYTRKDGTVVQAHVRSAPGTASHPTTPSVSKSPAPATRRTPATAPVHTATANSSKKATGISK
jgi:hypothetical protein